jgi:DNA-binding XRE family transcriptional regulator
MSEFITRLEAAKLLGVTLKTIFMMEKTNRIKTPTIKFYYAKTKRVVIGYNRSEFTKWADTNPIKHHGYRDPVSRQSREIRSAPSESDIYHIQRTGGKPFVYSGYAKWWILNFQPALRERYNYD